VAAEPASAPNGSGEAQPAEGQPPTGAPPAEQPAPEAAAATAATPSFRITPPRAAHPVDRRDRTWIELQQASRYREALAAAERVGFSGLCGRLDAGELIALGDVARLAGNPTRAEEAYLAARRRDPRLDRSVFALGLVAFEHRRRYNEAATWFAQYVESYPKGELVTEAAGRLIESWQRAGKPDEAKKAARSYLEKYPSGPHAALARQIAGS
jgi:tetratricopeptide (TPR) repeat protein